MKNVLQRECWITTN